MFVVPPAKVPMSKLLVFRVFRSHQFALEKIPPVFGLRFLCLISQPNTKIYRPVNKIPEESLSRLGRGAAYLICWGGECRFSEKSPTIPRRNMSTKRPANAQLTLRESTRSHLSKTSKIFKIGSVVFEISWFENR